MEFWATLLPSPTYTRKSLLEWMTMMRSNEFQLACIIAYSITLSNFASRLKNYHERTTICSSDSYSNDEMEFLGSCSSCRHVQQNHVFIVSLSFRVVHSDQWSLFSNRIQTRLCWWWNCGYAEYPQSMFPLSCARAQMRSAETVSAHRKSRLRTKIRSDDFFQSFRTVVQGTAQARRKIIGNIARGK